MTDTLPLLRLLAGQLRAGMSEEDRHRWALVVDGIAERMMRTEKAPTQDAFSSEGAQSFLDWCDTQAQEAKERTATSQSSYVYDEKGCADPQPVRYYRVGQRSTDGTWIDKCSCGWMPKPGEKVVMVGGNLACPVCLAKEEEPSHGDAGGQYGDLR